MEANRRAAGESLRPRAWEDLELQAGGAAGRLFLVLDFLLRQGKRRAAQFAGADLEHRLTIVKAGRQEQVSRVVPRYHTVLEFHDRQPDVELLPGGRLSLPGQGWSELT